MVWRTCFIIKFKWDIITFWDNLLVLTNDPKQTYFLVPQMID